MAQVVAELPWLVSKSHEKHLEFLQTQLHVICCYFECPCVLFSSSS